jgi:hypothetical protein
VDCRAVDACVFTARRDRQGMPSVRNAYALAAVFIAEAKGAIERKITIADTVCPARLFSGVAYEGLRANKTA